MLPFKFGIDSKRINQTLLLFFNTILISRIDSLLLKTKVILLFIIFRSFSNAITTTKCLRNLPVKADSICMVYHTLNILLVVEMIGNRCPQSWLRIATFRRLYFRRKYLPIQWDAIEVIDIREIALRDRILSVMLHLSIFVSKTPKRINQSRYFSWLHLTRRHRVIIKRLAVEIQQSCLLLRES